MQRHFLGTRKLHLHLHLDIIDQRELAKIHAAETGWLALRRGGTLCKNIQQSHRVALDKSPLVLMQLLTSIT